MDEYETMAGLQQRLAAVEGALRELVALKTLKDRVGKTAAYRMRQPKAWEAALHALGGGTA